MRNKIVRLLRVLAGALILGGMGMPSMAQTTVQGSSPAGSPPIGYPLLFGGWDGTNGQILKVDSAGLGWINLSKANNVTILMGAGATGTGSMRVTAAQDTTTIAGSAPGTAGTPSANVVTVQGKTGMTPIAVDGSGVFSPSATTLNTYSVHLTTNTTTTPTSSTAYISSITIAVASAGTTSTVTIKDKSGTPLTLVSGFSTATLLSNGNDIYNFQTPVKMVSGIDIVTAGAGAATVDVWINYYQ